MHEPARVARTRSRTRRRPAKPGLLGRLFVYSLQPPPRWWSRLKAPRSIRPRAAPPLGEAYASFVASQEDVSALNDEPIVMNAG